MSRAAGPLLLLLLLGLWAAASAGAPPAGVLGDSVAISELLGRASSQLRPQPAPDSDGGRSDLRRSDPYDEFAEPRRLDWPEGGGHDRDPAEWIRRRALWRAARHPDLARRQRALERLGPAMKPHARDERLDRPDPYSEFASTAYYQFVRAILDMRNSMTTLAGFGDSSAMREFFEETPPGKGGTTAAPEPTSPGPTMTPSPPVQVCPPQWRLGKGRCERNATFCFKDSECRGTKCCFDGCKLRCLEPELLVRHVCTDYMNSTVIPGDLYMYQRTQMCTCDPLGRPVGCRDKKPCIDVISSSLFKLPFINDKTAKLSKPERSTRQKIYDALQEAFKHVKTVY